MFGSMVETLLEVLQQNMNQVNFGVGLQHYMNKATLPEVLRQNMLQVNFARRSSAEYELIVVR